MSRADRVIARKQYVSDHPARFNRSKKERNAELHAINNREAPKPKAEPRKTFREVMRPRKRTP